jgi:cytochrome c peroxidase
MRLATCLRNCLPAAGASLLLAGCLGQSGESPAAGTPATAPTLSPLAPVGELIFHDVSLSASGRQACSSCHVAEHAFVGADGRAVPLGGEGLDQMGCRNTPSIRYLAYNPAFRFDTEGTPAGGFQP